MLLARFDRPLDLSREERLALLGGKGDGLMRMAGELGLPVPPGFTLTTRACAVHREQGWTDSLEQALREGIAGLEAATGRRFGAARGREVDTPFASAASPVPLLVSVRSGASISMPGMLDTVLNVGLDDETTTHFACENPRLAEACRVRLAASFTSILGSPPPPDAWSQLRAAILAVFRSAESARADAYRRREGLKGDPVTAVNVQTMVFGNRDPRSATGVFFTRDPSTGESRPYGDVLFEAQGEDVVSGRRRTQSLDELGERLPDAARALFEIGRRLERTYRDLCEIEFTIESGVLWLLQVRVGKRSPRAALRIAAELALDPDFPLDRREAIDRTRRLLVDPPALTSLRTQPAGEYGSAIARGLGASPGIASGEVETRVDRAVARAAAGHAVLLVRPETSPDDVEGMAVARGLLTATGGLASHAAVVARGWGIPAVVGLLGLEIDDEGIALAGHRIAVGETLTIDGTSGEVYLGPCEVEQCVVPEAARLLAWADELGIDLEIDVEGEVAVERVDPRSAKSPSGEESGSESTEDAILRALSIKGSATREVLACVLAVDAESVGPLIDRLITAGDLTHARPAGLRLSEGGRLRADLLLVSDRMVLGVDVARDALAGFQPLDAHMKQAVTDWQLRLDGPERVPNDHTNARWDAAVTDRLTTTLDQAETWLAPLAARLPRLRHYATRLDTALEKIGEGDGRFVASPRVDSLHGVWFELHEDLIRLAGSSRADELAAGRSG